MLRKNKSIEDPSLFRSLTEPAGRLSTCTAAGTSRTTQMKIISWWLPCSERMNLLKCREGHHGILGVFLATEQHKDLGRHHLGRHLHQLGAWSVVPPAVGTQHLLLQPQLPSSSEHVGLHYQWVSGQNRAVAVACSLSRRAVRTKAWTGAA